MVYLKTDEYRNILMSISWFKKLLNELIARSVNIDHNITNPFEKVLLTCIAYMASNLIPTAIANFPKNSDYTFI